LARILLTGGAGYIGSHTYVALTAAGHEVVILDNFANAREDVIPRLEMLTGQPVQLARADVCDPAAVAQVMATHRPEAVIHFAARKAVGESGQIPLEYIATNVGGLISLLQAMQAAGVFALVYSSSATVYAEAETMPLTEDAPRGYASTYAWTKLAGEQILEQTASADLRWRFGVLRYFNPAGANPSGLIGEDPEGIPNNLMPYIARVAAGRLGALRIFGTDYPTPDGTGVRDYILVMDLAEGHVASVQALLARSGGHVLNLGTGRGHSVLEVLTAYEAACGRPLPRQAAPRRAGDLAAYWADPTRARSELGFEARRDLAQMCRDDWAWISRRANTLNDGRDGG
jgi:UDP-glucose 4-epimerase